MLRLLAGCNQLRTNMDTHIPYNERICIYCDNDCVEDLFHFVMICDKFADIRVEMMERIMNGIPEEEQYILNDLTKKVAILCFDGHGLPYAW